MAYSEINKKMKSILLVFIAATFVYCDNKPIPTTLRKEIYSYVSIEAIHKEATGNLTSTPFWDGPHKMPFKDSFYVYENSDSIRMFAPDTVGGYLFSKIELKGYKWKPQQLYGKDLIFQGLYERDPNEGLRFTIYATKDWSTLMQIVYTNPGNMTTAILFSKDSINILKHAGIIIDPTQEISEPEKLVPVN